MQTETTYGELKRPYFHNINGLRFIGAILILTFHSFSLSENIWGEFFDDYWFLKVRFLIGRGHLGIILFFVLSGFLITNILLWEYKTKGRIQLFNFLIRRFLRVWPLYFLIVLFGFFIFPILPNGIETVHELWRFLLFMPNIDEIINGPNDSINFLSVTWTIGVEEQFYLLWGVIVTLFTLNGPLKKNFVFILGFAVILFAICFRYYHLGDNRNLYYHTLSVMSDLAFGCIIGAMAVNGTAEKLVKHLAKWKIVLIYILSLIYCLYEGHIFKNDLFVFERIVPAIIFCFVILDQVYAENSFFKLDKIRGFFFSGEITYSIYVLHSIYIFYWAKYFEVNGYTTEIWQFILFYALVLGSTYLTALVTYYTVEKPIFKLRKHFR